MAGGGWLEQFGIKLISTQVEVEVGVELGKNTPVALYINVLETLFTLDVCPSVF